MCMECEGEAYEYVKLANVCGQETRWEIEEEKREEAKKDKG